MPTKKKNAHPTSIRVSETCMELWNLASQQMGVSKVAIVEIAIREYAARNNVALVGNGGVLQDTDRLTGEGRGE
jgi:hypothetical protein